MDTNNSLVVVAFKTTQEHYRISTAPIQVPLNASPADLADLINHLLEQTLSGTFLPYISSWLAYHMVEHQPVKFNFFINEQLISTSLLESTTDQGLSIESFPVAITYLEADPLPNHEQRYPHPDWIRSIAVASHNHHVLTGSYDSIIRAFPTSPSPQTESSPVSLSGLPSLMAGHKACVTCLAVASDPMTTLISGSNDHTLRLWNAANNHHPSAYLPVAILQGHAETVQSVATYGELVLSGDFGGNLCAWSTNLSQLAQALPAAGKTAASRLKKRRQQASKPDQCGSSPASAKPPIYMPKWHMPNIHGTGAISGINFSTNNAFFTCGWDQVLNKWDAKPLSNFNSKINPKSYKPVLTIKLESVATCMDVSTEKVPKIAIGHPDGRISIIEDGPDHFKVLSTQQIHAGWISSIAWSPQYHHLLVTASHDGIAAIWDLRSLNSGPLRVLVTCPGKKMLAVAWNHDGTIFIGGESCILHLFR